MTASKIRSNFKGAVMCAKFGLRTGSEERFYNSQWAIPPVIFVGYRLVLLIYFFVWLILSLTQGDGVVDSGEEHPDATSYAAWWWTVYLTNWSYTTFNIYLVIAALNVTINYIRNRRKKTTIFASQDKTLPILCSVHWLTYNLQAGLNLLVVIVFWAVLVPVDEEVRKGINAVSINVHLINGVATLVDMFVVAIPINLAHVIYVLVFALVYISFSLIFWAAGGEPFPIYAPLNYEEGPAVAAGLITGLGLVGIPLLWLAVYGLTNARKVLWRRFNPEPMIRTSDLELKRVPDIEVISRTPEGLI